uniref:Transmembrane protein 25 n=1 Tax=Chelonoidis abingdonii TaxID=106734 RepID=A0A8C0IMF5_CHEAB
SDLTPGPIPARQTKLRTPSIGLGEPDPKINGQSLLVSTMQEDESRDFTCQVDSWQVVPVLTWYLNGKKQETNGSTVLTTLAEAFEQSSSTFTVMAQRADRELNCSLTDPASGKTSNASVLLNVQFKPEIVTMNAKYQEAKDPGLFMVLFVLVRANPPASITWLDQDGHVMVNTSDFLILDTKSYPWLTNHTVQVQLSSMAKNFSFTAANNVGITNSSILQPGLLDTRVELPLLALTVGGVLVLGTLLCLNTLLICVICRKGKAPFSIRSCCSDSNNLKLNSVRLPRENMSLPSNLQLNDLMQEVRGVFLTRTGQFRGMSLLRPDPGLHGPVFCLLHLACLAHSCPCSSHFLVISRQCWGVVIGGAAEDSLFSPGVPSPGASTEWVPVGLTQYGWSYVLNII